MRQVCVQCGKAIQLVCTRRPSDGAQFHFWVHTECVPVDGPVETHKAVPL